MTNLSLENRDKPLVSVIAGSTSDKEVYKGILVKKK